MTMSRDRRRFLQSSLAGGAVLGLAGAEAAPVRGPAQAASTGRDDTDNPRVAAGRVRWHESFDRACQAGRDSGKPVFLFPLMGLRWWSAKDRTGPG